MHYKFVIVLFSLCLSISTMYIPLLIYFTAFDISHPSIKWIAFTFVDCISQLLTIYFTSFSIEWIAYPTFDCVLHLLFHIILLNELRIPKVIAFHHLLIIYFTSFFKWIAYYSVDGRWGHEFSDRIHTESSWRNSAAITKSAITLWLNYCFHGMFTSTEWEWQEEKLEGRLLLLKCRLGFFFFKSSLSFICLLLHLHYFMTFSPFYSWTYQWRTNYFFAVNIKGHIYTYLKNTYPEFYRKYHAYLILNFTDSNLHTSIFKWFWILQTMWPSLVVDFVILLHCYI